MTSNSDSEKSVMYNKHVQSKGFARPHSRIPLNLPVMVTD